MKTSLARLRPDYAAAESTLPRQRMLTSLVQMILHMLSYALFHQRVVVTHDDDYTRLHANGIPHAGICYCHMDKHPIGDLLRLLMLIHECCDAEEMRGHLEYL